MDRFISTRRESWTRFWFHNPAHGAFAFCLVSITAYAIAGPSAPLAQSSNGKLGQGIHQCQLPPFENQTAYDDCAPLALLYAEALEQLAEAQALADSAYEAWYACNHPGETPTPSPGPVEPSNVAERTHSILDR